MAKYSATSLYDGHSLQHPFDLTHPGFDSLARNGDGGLELLGKEGDLVLLDHPDKFFQRQTLLPGGIRGETPEHLVVPPGKFMDILPSFEGLLQVNGASLRTDGEGAQIPDNVVQVKKGSDLFLLLPLILPGRHPVLPRETSRAR